MDDILLGYLKRNNALECYCHSCNRQAIVVEKIERCAYSDCNAKSDKLSFFKIEFAYLEETK